MTTKIIEPITPNTQDTTAPLALGWWEVLRQLRRCESDEAAQARTASEELEAEIATIHNGHISHEPPDENYCRAP